MKLIKRIPGIVLTLIILLFALALDFLAYSFLSACPACSSFSHFITTQSSLSAPLIASLSTLFTLTGKRK